MNCWIQGKRLFSHVEGAVYRVDRTGVDEVVGVVVGWLKQYWAEFAVFGKQSQKRLDRDNHC